MGKTEGKKRTTERVRQAPQWVRMLTGKRVSSLSALMSMEEAQEAAPIRVRAPVSECSSIVLVRCVTTPGPVRSAPRIQHRF